MRYRKVRYLGSTASQGEALARLSSPADIVLVERGVPRSAVMRCPDGCGELLTINLDRRTGKAWRFYDRDNGVSLYPSVWRTTGCRSHFIIWEGGIYWNDGRDGFRRPLEYERLTDAVLRLLSFDRFTSPESIADDLEEVPWAIASVCRKLKLDGQAEEGVGNLEGSYRLLHAAGPLASHPT